MTGNLARMTKVQSAMSDTFSQVIKKHREKCGFSRAELAQKAGLHQTYIGLLEREKRSPNLDTANTIANALGMKLSDLVAEAERFCKR